MQELGDGPRAGRRRLAAVPGDQGGAAVPAGRPRPTPVVPAHRLLEAAGALSDGATALHDQLRDLDPEEREAIVELVTEQVIEVVRMWADVVKGVVDSEALDGAGGGSRRSARPAPVATGRGSDTTGHPAHVGPDEFEDEPQPVFRREPAELAGDADRLTRDGLTGVLNRQAGFAALGREIERCRRGGERLVLGYLNVDALKAVNDARGTHGGDELLRKVTAALRATLRSYDVITRLGGDEFLFSLPGTDIATADLRFKEFAAILAEESPGSSASVGFAEFQEADTLDDLIGRAETAMLRGRRNRRRGHG
jgi:diguanylate cyclase (GGDEF)-like protein